MQIDPNKLAEARLARVMSQEEAAIASDLSARTIQRIEAGQPASLESTKALLTIFGADILCDPAARADAADLPGRGAVGAGVMQAPSRAASWTFDGLRLLFAAAFLLTALAKPFAPDRTGLFVRNYLSESGNRIINGTNHTLGFLAQPPVGSREILGYWVMPIMLLAAIALLLSIGRVRRVLHAQLSAL